MLLIKFKLMFFGFVLGFLSVFPGILATVMILAAVVGEVWAPEVTGTSTYDSHIDASHSILDGEG